MASPPEKPPYPNRYNPPVGRETTVDPLQADYYIANVRQETYAGKSSYAGTVEAYMGLLHQKPTALHFPPPQYDSPLDTLSLWIHTCILFTTYLFL